MTRARAPRASVHALLWLLAALLAAPACLAFPPDAAAHAPARTVVIVLDNGPAMTGPVLAAAREGLSGLVGALPADAAAGLAVPGASLAPATDRAPLLKAAAKVRQSKEGRVLDAVSGALGALPAGGERRLVVVTAGEDTASRAKLGQVTRNVALKGVPVELLGVGPAVEKSPLARRLATVPGSHVTVAENPARLAALMTEAGRGLFGPAAAAPTPAASTASAPAAAATPSAPAPASPAAGTAVGVGFGAVLGLCFVSILTAAYLIGDAFFGPRSDVSHRIEQYRPGSRSARAGERGLGGVLEGLLGFSRSLVQATGRTDKIADHLAKAGWSLAPHEWALVRGIACLVAAVGLWLLTDNLLLGLLLGLALPLLVARMVLSSARNRRVQAFGDQLPDALAMIAGSLRSGFTVSQSLERLGAQEVQPLGVEMARALAQTKIGVSVEDALEQVAHRMDCPDLLWVVMTIRIQREVGGNLADVIETTMETMRERTRLRGHIRALSAEGRMSGQVLLALPILLTLGMMIFRPDYLRPLFASPMGLVMLMFGAGSMAVGWFWISRMIKIEA